MLMLLCGPRIKVLFGYVNVLCFLLLKILVILWSFLTWSFEVYFYEMSICYNIDIHSTFQLNKLQSPAMIAVDYFLL